MTEKNRSTWQRIKNAVSTDNITGAYFNVQVNDCMQKNTLYLFITLKAPFTFPSFSSCFGSSSSSTGLASGS